MSKPNNAQGAARWSITGPEPEGPSTLTDLVLAWAKDSATGQPRYIFELGLEQTGSRCGCECYSCGLPLTAVNAGKSQWLRRPHFRHPEGAQRDACLVLSARAAALEMLRQHDVLTLPARRIGATITGLSGKKYDAWVTTRPEPVRISTFKVVDQVSALLTLDDGRQLKVSLSGKMDGETSGGVPTIVLAVDDPKIAAMSPGELKSKLHLLVEEASWCGHWNDPELQKQADRQVRDNAEQALDWLEDAAIADSQAHGSRETLLHYLAKQILEQAGHIRLPPLHAQANARLPNGEVDTRNSVIPGSTVSLGSVTLEKRMGNTRPDVVAAVAHYNGAEDLVNPLWTGPLLVEVTVTNGIDEERRQKIRKLGFPALEFDISSMGGTITREEFVRLLIEEEVGKRWIHHPWLETEQARLEEEQAPVREVLNLPRDQLAKRYLEAVVHHSHLRSLDHPVAELASAREMVLHWANALSIRGYPEAADERFWRDQGCILDRLLTIRHDKVVGYRLVTTWQVLNAILCEGEPHTRWQTLYLTALKVYRPKLSAEHEDRVATWRARVKESLEAGEDQYRRTRRYDKLVSILFPEMAPLLSRQLPNNATLQSQRDDTERANTDVDRRTAQRFAYGHYSNDGWLHGKDLEEWKRRHPEAAEKFYGSKK